MAPGNATDCYVIWDFAENKDGAKQFLVHLTENFAEAFKASEFYSFPCFPSTVPNTVYLPTTPKPIPRISTRC
jgi:multiple sugar transport system substrate-binding protein